MVGGTPARLGYYKAPPSRTYCRPLVHRSHGISSSFNIERPHRENLPRVEGKAWSEPETPPADPDKVVTSRRDPHDPYWPNGAGMHVAYNPLTQNQRELPPMKFARPPYVTNLHVTAAENRYQVIAIGSQASGTHPRKTEIYDSISKQWTEAAELPEGYLIDRQTGVYHEGYLYVTGSMELYGPKVVMVFDPVIRNWLVPIDLPSRMTFPTTVQLLQCNGAIYLFSQDVYGLQITHCIHRLNPGSEGHTWTKKVTQKFVKKKPVSRAKYTCVPLKGKQGTQLGIFKNSCLVHAVTESVCRVYDITEDEAEITAASRFLPCPPFASEYAVLFHPENPVEYSFEPSFFVDA